MGFPPPKKKKFLKSSSNLLFKLYYREVLLPPRNSSVAPIYGIESVLFQSTIFHFRFDVLNLCQRRVVAHAVTSCVNRFRTLQELWVVAVCTCTFFMRASAECVWCTLQCQRDWFAHVWRISFNFRTSILFVCF